MHVLHRSHLSRPVAVSVIAAILAITLTLLAGLGAVSSNTGSTSTPGPLGATASQLSAPMARDPFERLLTSSPALRWGTSNSVPFARANATTVQ